MTKKEKKQKAFAVLYRTFKEKVVDIDTSKLSFTFDYKLLTDAQAQGIKDCAKHYNIKVKFILE